MSKIDGNKYISQISIPGTHDSGSRRWGGFAADQDLSIPDQLTAGVRFFDIRLIKKLGFSGFYLKVTHNFVSQQESLRQVLVAMINFLNTHPGETIILSLKHEGDKFPSSVFENEIYNEIQRYKRYIWLNNYIPKLSVVRSRFDKYGNKARIGKIVLIRRFPLSASRLPLGLDATKWEDNKAFAIRNMSIEDIYDDVPTGKYRFIPTLGGGIWDEIKVPLTPKLKWQYVTEHMRRAILTGNNNYYDPYDSRIHHDIDIRLYITFTSAYDFSKNFRITPAAITYYSDYINPQIINFLSAYSQARTGILAMDFVNSNLTWAVIGTNGI